MNRGAEATESRADDGDVFQMPLRFQIAPR